METEVEWRRPIGKPKISLQLLAMTKARSLRRTYYFGQSSLIVPPLRIASGYTSAPITSFIVIGALVIPLSFNGTYLRYLI